jgi:type VI secretion system protein ImpM
MRCGLFGKLPAKRDFIAVSAPRVFLRLWEPWLEKGLTEARARVGEADFAAAYNSAPIWRFWLGPALCGEAFAGAFMPSVDALGRMFPLTLIGASAGAGALAPPDAEPREQWFTTVEALLLDALDPDASLEELAKRLDGLGCDFASAHRSALERLQAKQARLPAQLIAEGGDLATGADAAEDSSLRIMFKAMRGEQPSCPPEAATFWWTIGGGGECPPLAMMHQSMPGPATFADMLSRRHIAQGTAEKESRLQAIAQLG